MDVDGDEYEGTDDDVEAERQEEPQMMKDADRWDRFLAWVRDVHSPWLSDTDEYRKERALDYFNHCTPCPAHIPPFLSHPGCVCGSDGMLA